MDGLHIRTVLSHQLLTLPLREKSPKVRALKQKTMPCPKKTVISRLVSNDHR